MKVAIGSDHAGVAMKASLIASLRLDGWELTDVGAHIEESCDYPEYAVAVARQVASGEADRGVLICGTGVGMAIAANKVRGVRAASVSEPVSAALARSHNDANVVCLGARIVGPEVALEVVRAFLSTAFSGGERHTRRVEQIRRLDNRRDDVAAHGPAV